VVPITLVPPDFMVPSIATVSGPAEKVQWVALDVDDALEPFDQIFRKPSTDLSYVWVVDKIRATVPGIQKPFDQLLHRGMKG
jgi:hypothetical protein